GRILVAMWITHVPSAWKADAIATRSSPASCRAHRTISPGSSRSKRSFASATSAAGSNSCMAVMLPAPDRTKGFRMPNEDTIPAHGGTLIDLLVTGAEAGRLTEEAEHHPKL